MTVEVLRALLYLAAGLDLGSTWKGMAAGQREANLILGQNRLVQGLLVIGSVGAVDFMSRWAVRHDSTAGAIVSLSLVGGVHLVAFLLNLRSVR